MPVDPKILKLINKTLERIKEGGLEFSNEDPEQTMKRIMGFKNNPAGHSLFDAYTKSLEDDAEKEADGMGAFM